MKASEKSVGEVFDLLLRDDPEMRKKLISAARLATYAENSLWLLWRMHDPITATEMVRRAKEKDETGKWPKMEPYVLNQCEDGKTPTEVLKSICSGLYAYVYDAIRNHVRKLYPKKRLSYLRFDDRLPCSDSLRIRFRESAVTVRRDPANPRWFQVGLKIVNGELWWISIKAAGKSPATYEWLNHLADSGANPSGGTISSRKKRGKLVWQIALARERQDGERATVKNPVPDRELVCFAPLDQSSFLVCEVAPRNGRPWRETIEATDLCLLKNRHEECRRSLGRHYSQSESGGFKGHGRNRAIRKAMSFKRHYEARIKDWIENRSMAIVRRAIATRCAKISFEHLSERDPATLQLGSFPYFRLIDRTKQKAKEAGIEFELYPDLEAITRRLAV